MDKEVGHLLQQLQDDGLADNTIVFFFSDHGFGLPRFKRTLYDTGLHVPFIVRLPAKYQYLTPSRPGTKVDRLVSFIDFAPTILGLTGLPVPKHMQGQAFLGAKAGRERQYIFGASSRVDEAYEMSRCVRDKRYKYIRNYMPHLPSAQISAWPDQARIMKELRRLAAEGKLAGPQKFVARPTKPIEELYDTQRDPFEIKNLVDSQKHKYILLNLRQAHRKWIADTRDVGFLPEAEMHIRAKGKSPYEIAQDFKAYPQSQIVSAAELVGKGPDTLPKMVESLKDKDGAVRYWAAVALGAVGTNAAPAADELQKALTDGHPNVRFAAAAVLCKLGSCEDALRVLVKGLEDERPWVMLHAARQLQNIGDKACPAADQIKKARRREAGGLYEMFIHWALDGALHNCESD
jgi:uncharacterized sulfatase